MKSTKSADIPDPNTLIILGSSMNNSSVVLTWLIQYSGLLVLTVKSALFVLVFGSIRLVVDIWE